MKSTAHQQLAEDKCNIKSEMKLMMSINNEPSLADVLCFTANSLAEVRQTEAMTGRDLSDLFR